MLAVGSLFRLFTSSRSEFAVQLGLAIATPAGYSEISARYGGVFSIAGGVCIAALADQTSRTRKTDNLRVDSSFEPRARR